MRFQPQKIPSHNNRQLLIQFLGSLHRYHFNIRVVPRLYHRIYLAQISWSNIENQRRYATICAYSLSITLENSFFQNDRGSQLQRNGNNHNSGGSEHSRLIRQNVNQGRRGFHLCLLLRFHNGKVIVSQLCCHEQWCNGVWKESVWLQMLGGWVVWIYHLPTTSQNNKIKSSKIFYLGQIGTHYENYIQGFVNIVYFIINNKVFLI